MAFVRNYNHNTNAPIISVLSGVHVHTFTTHRGVIGDIFLLVALYVTNKVMIENAIHTKIILQNSALTEIYGGITHMPNKVTA